MNKAQLDNQTKGQRPTLHAEEPDLDSSKVWLSVQRVASMTPRTTLIALRRGSTLRTARRSASRASRWRLVDIESPALQVIVLPCSRTLRIPLNGRQSAGARSKICIGFEIALTTGTWWKCLKRS